MSKPPQSPNSPNPQWNPHTAPSAPQPSSNWGSKPSAPTDPNSAQNQQASAWNQGNVAWHQSASSWNHSEPSTPGTGHQPSAPRQLAPEDDPVISGQFGQRPTVARTSRTPRPGPHRRRLAPLLLSLAAIIAFLGVWWLAGRTDNQPEPEQTPTATRTVPSVPPSGEYRKSIPFSSGSLSGTFTVNESHWEDSLLLANVTIHVDSGDLQYRFFAMSVTTNPEPKRMDAAPGPDGLKQGELLKAGDSATGVVQIYKERGPTAIILGTTAQKNLAMLKVKG